MHALLPSRSPADAEVRPGLAPREWWCAAAADGSIDLTVQKGRCHCNVSTRLRNKSIASGRRRPGRSGGWPPFLPELPAVTRLVSDSPDSATWGGWANGAAGTGGPRREGSERLARRCECGPGGTAARSSRAIVREHRLLTAICKKFRRAGCKRLRAGPGAGCKRLRQVWELATRPAPIVNGLPQVAGVSRVVGGASRLAG
jgi:hypothetical protein